MIKEMQRFRFDSALLSMRLLYGLMAAFPPRQKRNDRSSDLRRRRSLLLSIIRTVIVRISQLCELIVKTLEGKFFKREILASDNQTATFEIFNFHS